MPQPTNLNPRIIEALYAEGLALSDEVRAAFDPARRTALYASLARTGAQVWMTGADPQAFAELAGQAAIFEVKSGAICPR